MCRDNSSSATMKLAELLHEIQQSAWLVWRTHQKMINHCTLARLAAALRVSDPRRTAKICFWWFSYILSSSDRQTTASPFYANDIAIFFSAFFQLSPSHSAIGVRFTFDNGVDCSVCLERKWAKNEKNVYASWVQSRFMLQLNGV